MRILYVATKYDYGKPGQGLSFEHTNFFDCLHHMGEDILHFDFMALMQAHDRGWMNRRLVEVAKAEKPDLMFVFLAEEELDKSAVREITDQTDTPTFNWFADDHFRFDGFSRYWAPCFNWVSTTAQSALPKYAEIGYQNVIKTQWASNPYSYRKLDLPMEYDVTFVGQPHSNRREVIAALRHAGINVQTWGQGWEAGRATQEEMIRLFNQSRINLNLTQAPTPTTPLAPTAAPFAKRVLRAVGRRLRPGRQTGTAPPAVHYEEQIKGRNFEVPGCGGFLLTSPADNLSDYYAAGEEIATFIGVDQLTERIRYYLSHEAERAAVAEAGWRRTLAEHTYVHRFTEIFRVMGLPARPAQELLSGSVRPGFVEAVAA